MDLVAPTLRAIREKIPGLGTSQLGPEYAYHSLPLCVIDSVFSIGVKYANSQKAVESWCQSQQPLWVKFQADGEPRSTIDDLIRITEGYEGVALADKFFGGNKQRTSTRSGVLKAEAVVDYCKALRRAGVNDFADLKNTEIVELARAEVGKVTGHASGISFDYLMILAGAHSYIKADRMVCRFISEACGGRKVSIEDAKTTLTGACAELVLEYPKLTPARLDNLVWEYQSKIKSKR